MIGQLAVVSKEGQRKTRGGCGRRVKDHISGLSMSASASFSDKEHEEKAIPQCENPWCSCQLVQFENWDTT